MTSSLRADAKRCRTVGSEQEGTILGEVEDFLEIFEG